MPIRPTTALRLVKTVHTAAWAFFAACILVLPAAAWSGRFGLALVLIGLVLAEVLVLLVNDARCPLTDVAARYTEDRQDNFDIYLPLWMARYNKRVFGALFVVGLLITWASWVQRG